MAKIKKNHKNTKQEKMANGSLCRNTNSTLVPFGTEASTITILAMCYNKFAPTQPMLQQNLFRHTHHTCSLSEKCSSTNLPTLCKMVPINTPTDKYHNLFVSPKCLCITILRFIHQRDIGGGVVMTTHLSMNHADLGVLLISGLSIQMESLSSTHQVALIPCTTF